MKEKKEEKEEKEEEAEKWAVRDVPTKSEPTLVNNETKEIYTIEIALAQILNNQEKLKKLLD